MGEKVKVNFYIEAEIDQKIEDLAKITFRGKNDVVAWLVSEAWEKAQKKEGGGVVVTAQIVPYAENSTDTAD